MPSMTRRSFQHAAFAFLFLPASTAALAAPEHYPARPVTIVVPFAPGGATDIVARTVGQELSRRWSQPVLIDNKAGASGQIGTEFAGRARNDGYTLLLGTQAIFAVLPILNGRKDFNLDTGFTPISLLIKMPSLLMVPSTSPANTVGQLVTLLKAGKPGQYSFSSNGPGTSQQLIAEEFLSRVGVKANHVPYTSSTQALTALAAGDQIEMSVDNVPASLAFLRSGKVKALAITTATRSSTLPDVPTLAESGMPNFNASTWMGLVAPPGVPDDIRDFISKEVAEVLQAPEVRKKLESQSFFVQSTSPDDFRKLVKAETETLRVMLVNNNIPLSK